MSSSSTRARQAQPEYKIVEKDNQYRVFDKMGRFHRSFGNRPAAERFITEQTKRSTQLTSSPEPTL